MTKKTRFGLLIAVLTLALAGQPGIVAGASGTQAQERGTLLGPEEGETLTSWTERWLEGPVQYIATDEEKRIYRSLESTRQRLQFIRLFWERRDPTQRGPENEFVNEFVSRIEYADESFGNGQPGWKTVFGQVVLILGPPDRTERELGFPQQVSQRPVILWTYDKRIPEYPTNEKLMFVYQLGRWRLYPPSNFAEPPGVEADRRDLERVAMLQEIPSDFERTIQTTVRRSLAQPVSYDRVVNNIEADVVFPDVDIPFAYTAEFGGRTGDRVDITLELTWRMESLVFHVVDENFQTDMVVNVILLDDDGEPAAETSEPISIRVPVDELQGRSEELVQRSVTLSAAPGTYALTLTLEDQVLGYRTVYRDELVVPGRS